MNEKKLMPMYRAMLLLFTLFLASCGGRAAQDKPEPEPVSDPQLQAAYMRMLVLPVDIVAQLADDYPQAAANCRTGLVAGLEESKRFQVRLADGVPARTERDTLIVKLAITDMRIVAEAARRWGGPAAGSSYINVTMTLTDGHTGQVIRDKEFSTYNNALAASMVPIWADNTRDESIVKDMGKIIGDYITAVVP